MAAILSCYVSFAAASSSPPPSSGYVNLQDALDSFAVLKLSMPAQLARQLSAPLSLPAVSLRRHDSRFKLQ